MDEIITYSQENIQSRILTIRGQQVMLDRDLAEYFQVSTGALNQAVKRNIERFPERYRFQLSDEELENWKSQIVITNSVKMGLRQRPYAFTEQGVTQLSAVLRSPKAVEMSIRIIDAFVAMRRYIAAHAGVLQRLDSFEQFRIEMKQDLADTNMRIDQILDRLDDGSVKPKLGVFFDQQMFDAFALVVMIVQKATNRIVLIDDYVNADILQRFHSYAPSVSIDCYVKRIHQTAAMQQAFDTFRLQYPEQHCDVFPADEAGGAGVELESIMDHR